MMVLVSIVTITIGVFDSQVLSSSVNALSSDILEIKKNSIMNEVNNILYDADTLLDSMESFVRGQKLPLQVITHRNHLIFFSIENLIIVRIY